MWCDYIGNCTYMLNMLRDKMFYEIASKDDII